MKKILVGLFILSSVITLSACGNKTENETKESTDTSMSATKDLTDDETFFDELVKKISEVNSTNYNEDEYKLYDYKDLLRYRKDYLTAKLKLSAVDIIQIVDVGKYEKYLVKAPNDDLYMAFIEKRRLQTTLLEDDTLSINGRYLAEISYLTVNDTTKKVPLVYIDAYRLWDK